jgi:TonB family protein
MALAVPCSPCLAQASKPSDEPPAPAVEYDPKAWKEFSSAGGRFTVLLPGTPTEKVQSRDSPVGTLDVHDFTLITSYYYGVTYIEYPPNVEEGGDVKAFLDSVIGAGVKSVGGTLLEEKDISLDGHPGRFVRVQAGNGYVMRIRSYVVGNRIYQIGITMREADAPQAIAKFHDETAAKFLDSFRLVSGVADTEHRVVKGYAGEGGGIAAPAVQTEGEVDRLLKDKSTGILVMGSKDDSQPQSSSAPKRVVTGGVLEGRALYKPEPEYPPIAKAARAQGTVTVEIIVDEEGKVMAAQAESGHPLLQAAAVKAAREWRFSPTLLDGKPVKVLGLITITFALK